MRTNKERLCFARALKKYVRLGLADKRVGEYEKICIIRGVSKSESEFYDLVAVSDTIKVVSILGFEEELNAFITIYVKYFTGYPRISQSDINSNVIRYAMQNHCDTRTVYRRIASVSSLYKKARERYKCI